MIEYAGEGTDRVSTKLDAYTLGTNIENLTYTGTGNFTGTGNDLRNLLTGGAGRIFCLAWTALTLCAVGRGRIS